VDWIHVTHDTDKWRVLVNTVMNFLQKTNFLTRRVNVCSMELVYLVNTVVVLVMLAGAELEVIAYGRYNSDIPHHLISRSLRQRRWITNDVSDYINLLVIIAHIICNHPV
jgi:hypothetical protein